MKQLRHIGLMWLLPAVLLALAAAPAAQAGHQDFGTDFALRLTQHRTAVPLITENSYGQSRLNRSTPALAPSVPLITENSYGQNRPATRSATGSNAGEAPIQVARAGGFRWGDAGIGAGSAVALMLLVAGAALGVRRNRALRAYV